MPEQDPANELDQVVVRTYQQLKALTRQVTSASGGVDTTSILHDAYVKIRRTGKSYETDFHFLCVAAKTIRHLLVDRARKALSATRSAQVHHDLQLHTEDSPAEFRPGELLDLHESLADLEKNDARKARVVELRFFSGCSFEQVASVLGISTALAHREFTFARTWLFRRLDRK